MTTLEDFIELELSLDGLSGDKNPQELLDLIAPPPTDQAAWHELVMPNAPQDRNSTCLVLQEGVIRKLAKKYGLKLLQGALNTLNDWWDSVKEAQRVGAYGTPQDGKKLGPGCVYRIEVKGARHWRGVVGGELDTHGNGTLDTINGGGKNAKGYQLVHRDTVSVSKFVDLAAKPAPRFINDWIDVPALLDALIAEAHGKTNPPPSSTPAPSLPKFCDDVAEPSGLDISAVQGNRGSVDFTQVQKNVNFVYLRCGLGIDDVDKWCMPFAKACRTTHLDFGLYHVLYARHGRPQDAEKQAEQFIAHIRNTGSTLRPMIDVERAPGTEGCTAAEWALAIRLFVRKLVADGIRPFLYTGRWFWAELYPELQKMNELSELCDLWLAAYVDKLPPPVLPWKKVAIWQFKGGGPKLDPKYRGACPGIVGDVDVNKGLATLSTMRLVS